MTGRGTGKLLALVLVLLGSTSLITGATAADLGGRPVGPPADFYPPLGRPALDLERWTGFYLGGTLGYGFGNTLVGGDIGGFSFDTSGGLGTLFAGYNWQLGRTVLGLETDIGTGRLGSRTDVTAGVLRTELDAIGSFRARAGFLLTPALMLYGTAGLAWANMDFGIVGNPSRGETLFGYQLGLGGELMVSNHVTLRLEYIFTDLERERVIHSGMTNLYDPDFHQVRAGISLKF